MDAGITVEPPKLTGGNYTAIDTEDGYFTIKDVPVVSEIPKGVKGAPKKMGRAMLQSFVDKAQLRYSEGRYLSPLHIGHHQVFETKHPDFAGFILPQRVDKYSFGKGEDLWTIYADMKVKKAAFEKIQGGELPYRSAEISWKDGRLTSMSLLDSQPPHFEYELLTIGEVVKNPSARFHSEVAMPTPDEVAKLESDKKDEKTVESRLAALESALGKFMEDHDKDKAKAMDEHKDKDKAKKYEKDDEKESKMKGKCAADEDKGSTKPAGAPVDQEKADMKNDPAVAARLAAQEDRIAKLESGIRERENEEKAKALALKAVEEDLKGYQIGDKIKDEILRFAREGEERLAQFVATAKELCPKDTPSTLEDAEAGAVLTTDPSVAKFQQDGPEKLEMAMKFAKQYDELNAAGISQFMSQTRDEYIETQIALVAQRA